MTAMPREVARKRPANTPVRQQPTVIEGRFRAVRGGPTLASVLTWFVLILLAAGFAGSLLSTL